jgi:hypothetical protein
LVRIASISTEVKDLLAAVSHDLKQPRLEVPVVATDRVQVLIDRVENLIQVPRQRWVRLELNHH